MSVIFISHSTKNKELVKQVVDLLQTGMGIARNDIFCTLLNGELRTGEDFVSDIKKNMQECKMVIAVITPEYLQSSFCMMELGAAWIQTPYLCPFLAGDVDYQDLERSPLKGIQMRKLNDEADLYAVFDEMAGQKIIPSINSLQFKEKVQEFLQFMAQKTAVNGPLVYPDANAYYDVEIEQVRKVPVPYRCYKIKGRLVFATNTGMQEETDTHWIFYKAGVYDDLNVGDSVRLKIGKMERRHFSDIGWAVNIYPDEMKIVGRDS